MAKRRSKNKGAKLAVWLTAGAALLFIVVLAVLWLRREKEPRFVSYPAFGIHIPSDYEIHGIDVSKYQQKIGWKAVRNMEVNGVKIGFAFIKATEGVRSVDPLFRRNWSGAREAGLPRGAYHFFIAHKDGREQARHFIKRVQLSPGDLPPVLDVEQNRNTPAAVLRREVKEWLDAVEAEYGIQPIIYTNVDFYETYLQGYFDGYPLWVAHYLQRKKPRISRRWAFWQHSEEGRVNGIAGKVDFNVFNGDSAQFRSLLVP